MVVIKEVVNSRGLNFQNQRKVVILRTQTPRLAFRKIAERVRNLKRKASTEDVVRRVFQRFNMNKGRVQYNYSKCGRKPWKVTKEVGSYLVNQLRKERRHTVCTSTSLQADLCRDRKVHLSSSAVRKHLFSKGYKWKPRAQKRKYSHGMRTKRLSFTAHYYTKSLKAIHKAVSCAMDGVVLTVPPTDAVDRKNYCFHGITHMYRKDSEAASPELAGDDPYAQQVPIQRAIPMWGAISAKGFREIVFHRTRKLKTNDWVKVLKARKLKQAVQQLRATGPAPWKVLCDSESFLEAKPCRAQYKKQHLELIHIPARCPDLNPIESFWGWLRAHLRLLDLRDLRAKRRALGKTAYRVRIRNVLKSQKAQEVAKAKFNAFKKVCCEVQKKRGAASRS